MHVLPRRGCRRSGGCELETCRLYDVPHTARCSTMCVRLPSSGATRRRRAPRSWRRSARLGRRSAWWRTWASGTWPDAEFQGLVCDSRRHWLGLSVRKRWELWQVGAHLLSCWRPPRRSCERSMGKLGYAMGVRTCCRSVVVPLATSGAGSTTSAGRLAAGGLQRVRFGLGAIAHHAGQPRQPMVFEGALYGRPAGRTRTVLWLRRRRVGPEGRPDGGVPGRVHSA